MFYGIPVSPTLINHYAWSPKMDYMPEWIDNIYNNADVGNYLVYTRKPMRRFVMEHDDIIVKSEIGSATMYLIIKPDMWENWWEPNCKAIQELQESKTYKFDISEISNKLFD